MTAIAPVTAQRLRDAIGSSYAIDRELGRGGTATVYLAQDLRHERLVALKVLAPERVPRRPDPAGDFEVRFARVASSIGTSSQRT
jgi:serine/threonine protein kinase